MTSGDAVTVNTRGVAVMDAEQKAADSLIADGVPAALMTKAPGLWGPAAAAQAAVSLGWLTAPRSSRSLLGSLGTLAAQVREDGLDHVVLAATGGSSLASEAIGRSAGVALTVLDSTDPHEVAATLRDRLDSTLVVVSGKCGSTIETDSHRRIYERAFGRALGCRRSRSPAGSWSSPTRDRRWRRSPTRPATTSCSPIRTWPGGTAHSMRSAWCPRRWRAWT